MDKIQDSKIKQVQKPITMVSEEYRLKLIDITNQSELPLFILDYIIKDFYNQIHMANMNQQEVEVQKYNKQINALKETNVKKEIDDNIN